jgi:hypothetical protein
MQFVVSPAAVALGAGAAADAQEKSDEKPGSVPEK